MPLYRVPDTEINGDTGTIIGTAVYDYDTEMTFDRDIGGVDGMTLTHCELIRVEIDSARIDRAVIERIIGKWSLSRMEEAMAEHITLAEMEDDAPDRAHDMMEAAE